MCSASPWRRTPAFIRNLIETDEESEEAFAAHLKEKN